MTNIAQIPFSGFYESIHDSEIDHQFHQMFADDSGNPRDWDALVTLAHDGVSWSFVHRDYAKEFAKRFLAEFNIAGEFESVSSPREYNFETDRIFVTLAEGEAARMLAEINPVVMTQVAEARHESRSGFISFYDADWQSWGHVANWDHNQLCTLIIAFVGEFDECGIMECPFSNGFVDQIISDNGDERLIRAFRIHYYLSMRAERK